MSANISKHIRASLLGDYPASNADPADRSDPEAEKWLRWTLAGSDMTLSS